jgi:cytochrome P450
MCIGNNFAMMEMQIVLASILLKWNPIRVMSETIVPEPLITLRTKSALLIQFSKVE